MGNTLSRSKHDRKAFPNSKNMTHTTIIYHIKINERNNFNTSKSDNIIGTSNFPHSNVQNSSSFNKPINLKVNGFIVKC